MRNAVNIGAAAIIAAAVGTPAAFGGGCACDFDGNGVVDTDDLLVVVAEWGTPDGDCTGDGLTNVDDLILVVAEWGECDTSGDECDAAIEITEGVTAFDTTQATVNPDDPPWTCAQGGAPDLWFCFQSPCTAFVSLSTCADADYDTAIQVFSVEGSGCSGALTDVGCNDDGPGCPDFSSFLEFTATGGQYYKIRIGGFLGDTGTGNLTVACAPPCEKSSGYVNDCCNDAIPIEEGTTAYETTNANTDGFPHSECEFDGQTYHDIWFEHVASCDGVLRVSTCDDADYDTDLVVYDGCGDCDAISFLGCNDDTAGCDGFSSLLEVPVVAGNCYKIRVGGWNPGDVGTGNLSIECLTDFNFTCDAAEPLDIGGSETGDTTGAPTPMLQGICGGVIPTSGGLWYTVIGDGTTLTATTCNPGTLFDTQLIVICGDCDDQFCVAANDDDPVCFQNFVGESTVVFCSAPDQLYFILVTGGGPEGPFELSVTSDGVACDDPAVCEFNCEKFSGVVNDCCSEAIPINDGATAYDTSNANTDGPIHEGVCEFDGQTYHDIWYEYAATCTGTLTLSTCNDAEYDTDLVIYDGCGDCDNLLFLGCNDDTEGCADFTSLLEVPVVAGNCYLVRVGGWNPGDAGTGNLTITCGN